jgi:aspartyl protease family protein
MLARLEAWVFSASVVLCVATPAFAEPRTWTSADGRFSIEARLIEATATSVRLQRASGAEVTVPLQSLSEADRAFVAGLNPGETPAPDPVDAASAKALLEQRGVRVTSTSLALADEVVFNRKLAEAGKARRAVFDANKEWSDVQKKAADALVAVTKLTEANVQLNTQLAAVPPNNVAMHNRLVGLINANVGQIDLMEKAAGQIKGQADTLRAKANQAREQYVQQILDLRKLADSIAARYEQLASDPAVQKAVAQWSAAQEKPVELGQTRTFLSSMSRLKALEDTVLSEVIELRKGASDTLHISVVINGDHVQEMVLDSGASLVCLPSAMANDMGISISSENPKITLVLADGRQIEAHLVRLKSVRVGRFTMENVDCAVLSPEATHAMPLLGMSFLGNFKFEVDSADQKLTMIRVEDGGR